MWFWIWFVEHPFITMFLFMIMSWVVVSQVLKAAKWVWYKIFPFTIDQLIELGKSSHWQYAKETDLERESFVTGFCAGYMVGIFIKVKPNIDKQIL